jgi:hypothetical protein
MRSSLLTRCHVEGTALPFAVASLDFGLGGSFAFTVAKPTSFVAGVASLAMGDGDNDLQPLPTNASKTQAAAPAGSFIR